MNKGIRKMMLLRVPMVLAVVVSAAMVIWAVFNLETGVTRDTIFIIFLFVVVAMPALSFLLWFLGK